MKAKLSSPRWRVRLGSRMGHDEHGPQPPRLRPWRPSGARGRVIMPPPAGSQRAIVKYSILRPGVNGRSFPGILGAELAYIERDAAGMDPLYGAEGVRSREDFFAASRGDTRAFELIVSPEYGSDLDLTTYTQDFMNRVSRDLGIEGDWIAANHYDTRHPHTHIIIRGMEPDGREMYISSDYLTHGLRYRAQEIATQHLGMRREQEQERVVLPPSTPVRDVRQDVERTREEDDFDVSLGF
jgi:hypothetical protein